MQQLIVHGRHLLPDPRKLVGAQVRCYQDISVSQAGVFEAVKTSDVLELTANCAAFCTWHASKYRKNQVKEFINNFLDLTQSWQKSRGLKYTREVASVRVVGGARAPQYKETPAPSLPSRRLAIVQTDVAQWPGDTRSKCLQFRRKRRARLKQ